MTTVPAAEVGELNHWQIAELGIAYNQS